MKRPSKKTLFIFTLILSFSLPSAWSEESDNKEKAREALAGTEDEAVREQKELEEVFQAAERNYSLLKQGEFSLTYGANYSYFKDSTIRLDIKEGTIVEFDVAPNAEHTLANNFTVDYGIWDNLTLSATVPLIVKTDTETKNTVSDIGDLSFSLRWQPWSVVPGKMTKTLFATANFPTARSPYEIDLDERLSVGSGYYSLGAGISVSKVVDPVVLFGSLSYTHNFRTSGLNQVRGGRILESVDPGDSIGLSMGFAYSLSYDVSLSISYQQSFSLETEFDFDVGEGFKSTEQSSALMNFALGIRTAPDTIVNINAGFGLTEDSPDALLGFTVPLDIKGLADFSAK